MARLPAKRAKVVMSAIIATNRRAHPKRPSPLRVAATSPMRRANLTSTAKKQIVKLSALDAPIARLAAVADRRAAAVADAGTVVAAGVDAVHAAVAIVALAAAAAAIVARVAAEIAAETGRPADSRRQTQIKKAGPRIYANKHE